MKGCSFSGRSATVTEQASCGLQSIVARWLVVCAGVLFSASAWATPANETIIDIETVASGPVQNWIQAMDPNITEAFDPQIFTEISPLIESPEGVRLPDEQILTE